MLSVWGVGFRVSRFTIGSKTRSVALMVRVGFWGFRNGSVGLVSAQEFKVQHLPWFRGDCSLLLLLLLLLLLGLGCSGGHKKYIGGKSHWELILGLTLVLTWRVCKVYKHSKDAG